ncbi:MAG: hypothetical protein EAZ57_06025 [Cytophagales bacterium]|nr:MAG: hypothetical protein EAZ67_08215 [Cytophagales bacterium]TAF60799.1 MAG: hypothetical protein EAZ57_06025 [Cytophagales bacterium]
MRPDELLALKELEQNALFDAIQAINNNAQEEELYRIFHFTMRGNPIVKSFSLYVKDEGSWVCKTHWGNNLDFAELNLPASILAIKEPTLLTPDMGFLGDFDRVLPIKHKSEVLAYAFLSEKSPNTEAKFVHALSNIIIVAIENKKLARRHLQQENLKRQLDIAREVQSLLFPKKMPYHAQIKVAAEYKPHHSIGGDYYDFISISESEFLLCIADVSGKGVPAAILMSNFQAGLRILARQTKNLSIIVNELNRLIMDNSGGENFITAFFALFNIETKTLRYVNAGHNPPMLFRQNMMCERLSLGTTLLGTFSKLPMLDTGTVSNLNNFLLFAFTDGFTETYNETNEEFGEEVLTDFIAKNYDLPPRELNKVLLEMLDAFKGRNGFADDITLLTCRVMLP